MQRTYYECPVQTGLAVPANSSKVAFLSPSWAWADRQALLSGLSSGSVVGYDLAGAAIPSGAVASAVLDLASAADALAADLAAASPLTRLALKTSWNMDAAALVIAAVRADMLNAGLASVGTSGSAVLAKLQGVVTLVGLGMFAEAAAALAAVPVDGYLTAARIATYQAMLASADALALP